MKTIESLATSWNEIPVPMSIEGGAASSCVRRS